MPTQRFRRVLLTGGSGVLGRQIQRHLDCIAPARRELDVRRPADCRRAVHRYRPDLIIHAGAYTDVAGGERERAAAYATNALGTEHLVAAAHGVRFVYLSTEYVFDGARGRYRETDVPNPVNYYALTKLLGEVAVRQYPNTLIIRTSFKPDGPWPYPRAFVDQWTSADLASVRAPQIVAAALRPKLLGVIHIGGRRKTVYDLARRCTPNVGTMSIRDVTTVTLPRDTSLDTRRWRTLTKNTATR